MDTKLGGGLRSPERQEFTAVTSDYVLESSSLQARGQ